MESAAAAPVATTGLGGGKRAMHGGTEEAMGSSELELHPTEELVAELVRRRTFLGVVVQSQEEYRGDDPDQERVYKVLFNANLDSGRVARLLETVAAGLERGR